MQDNKKNKNKMSGSNWGLRIEDLIHITRWLAYYHAECGTKPYYVVLVSCLLDIKSYRLPFINHRLISMISDRVYLYLKNLFADHACCYMTDFIAQSFALELDGGNVGNTHRLCRGRTYHVSKSASFCFLQYTLPERVLLQQHANSVEIRKLTQKKKKLW